MTKYLADVDDDLWKALKICAALQGLKMKEAVDWAIRDFVKSHESSEFHIDFKVVQDTKSNLLTFIYEEQLKILIEEVLAAKKRGAPKPHMDSLKKRMLEIVQKHPTISKTLADEIVQVFKTLGGL